MVCAKAVPGLGPKPSTPRHFPCTQAGRPRDAKLHALLAHKRETETQLKKKKKKGCVVKIGRRGEDR